MPNIICNNLKRLCIEAPFSGAGKTFKIALFQAAMNPTTDYNAYATANEAAGGNYAAGGVTVANLTVTKDGDNYRVTFDNPSWTNLGAGQAVTYRYFLLYRSDITQNNALAIWDIGSNRTVSGTTETIEFGTGSNSPVNI